MTVNSQGGGSEELQSLLLRTVGDEIMLIYRCSSRDFTWTPVPNGPRSNGY